MLFSRILGGIGRSMIALGVLILLFVTYQLWGTGLRTNRAQDDLRRQFDAARTLPGDGGADTNGSVPRTTAPSTTAPGSGASSTTAPSTPPGSGVPAAGELPPPRPGQPIGIIKIPKIGADFAMVEGVDLNFLAEGPGHFPGTPFPGQAGNAALAGHRTTWQAPFNRIDELVPGDKVSIETVQGLFTYEILPQPGGSPEAPIGYRIIQPNQTEILDQPAGQNLLTLMACHPKYSAAQRIIVVGKLVDNPAPTTEKSAESQAAINSADQRELIEGSGGGIAVGRPEARGPALILLAVAGAIWLLAWFIARPWKSWRQWQKWTVYAVALPLFFVPLFFAFEQINKLLPAGY